MNRAISSIERVTVLTLLVLTAIFYPIPLYLTALACFGLPHVIWELSWVRPLFSKQLSPWCWKLAGLVLALQALARVGGWLLEIDHVLVQSIDLITLAILFMVATRFMYQIAKTKAHRNCAWLVLALALVLLYATWQQHLVMILAILAIAHYFTPLALVHALPAEAAKQLKHEVQCLFYLPIVLFAGLVLITQLHWPLPTIAIYDDTPSEALWLTQQFPQWMHAALSALVLAQCLHYYAVIRVIPAGLGNAFKLLVGFGPAILLCGLLFILFAYQFATAKNIYAIAAGAHAWLEWFLIAVLASNAFPKSTHLGTQ